VKLKRLDLKAFGPFTGKTLEFNSNHPGLHIIYGPNEAGKSSSLRALKALLFGFPQQTSDNFLHNYDQLLVGGSFENNAGEEIVFQRRKKRIGDIIDEKGRPLDSGILAPYLLGLEPEIFESLFGLDHDTLVKGGEEILAQKGDVGQALFAAGAGISSVQEVIDQLEKEAADLFKPAGKKPLINKAVNKFKQLKKKAKETALSSREWKDLQKALIHTEDERADLEKERIYKNSELRRLERLEQAIPELAALKSRQDELQALEKVILLPPDFSKRHQQISQAIREAELQLQKDKVRKEKLEEKCKTISFNKDLLNEAERVDDFHQRLGEYRKGQKDKPERNGMRISLRREAALLLQQVRPDLSLEEVETLRPVLSKKRTVQTLSTQYEAICQQLERIEKQKETAAHEYWKVEKVFSALPKIKKPKSLIRAFTLAQKAGNIDAQLEKSRRDVELSKKECFTELKRIGLWSGDFAALRELSLPLLETVQQFENRYSEIADERREIEKDRKKNQKELKKVQTEIKKIKYAGQVPSEEDLSMIREKREQGWQLIRRQWLNKEDLLAEIQSYDSKQPLPEAYEERVQKADQVSDRLRREADRVANMAAFHAQLDLCKDTLEENLKDKEALDNKAIKLDQAWTYAWQSLGITPLSPKEMRGWIGEMEKLRFKVADICRKEQEIEQSINQRENLRKVLHKELNLLEEKDQPSGEELGPILVFSETVIEKTNKKKRELEKLVERRKRAKKSFHQTGEDLKAAEKALAKWKTKWRKAILGLGLEDEVSPSEAIDLIETLKSCFDKVKEADDLKKRITGIDRDAEALEKEVKVLLKTVAPDILTLTLDQSILQLRIKLNRAQKNCTLYNQLITESESIKEEISATKKNLQSATEQMNELLRIAQCEKPEELAAVMNKFTEYQRLKEKISDIETTLAKIGAGAKIEELEKQAEEINHDELSGRIESLRTDIEDRINLKINQISQTIGEKHMQLAVMDGNAKTAQAAERMEQELAAIQRLAERYVRIKLAAKILQLEIERYREEHQDPVLKIASSYFRALTLDSFAYLRTDLDDKGSPILIGVRPDDARLTVEKMSTGTRDQLYLALRLAALKWRLENNEPIPFIIDDILINFDDERSKAALKTLSDLSKINQVILFTHHGRIVEEAKQIKANGSIHIHAL
jgi:uncharacterized protein YhaN